MKKILLVTIFLATCELAFSQLRIGIIGSYGISVSSSEAIVLGTVDGRKAYGLEFMEHKSQASVGLGLYKNIGNLFFVTEMHYRKISYQLQVENFFNVDEPMNYIDESRSTLHVPIAAGLRFGKIKIGVGPIFNYQLDHTNKLTEDYQFEDKSKDLNMGFQSLVGYDLNQYFSVNIKYERSFTRVGENYKYRGKSLPLNTTLDFLTLSVAMFL